jgi:hypothetical protein
MGNGCYLLRNFQSIRSHSRRFAGRTDRMQAAGFGDPALQFMV